MSEVVAVHSGSPTWVTSALGTSDPNPVTSSIQPPIGYVSSIVASAASLLYAASKNDVITLKSLLESGVKATIADYDRRTALHLACAEGSLKCCELLLEAGAIIDAHDRFGYAPLDDAIRHGQIECVKFMESKGAVNIFQNKMATSPNNTNHSQNQHHALAISPKSQLISRHSNPSNLSGLFPSPSGHSSNVSDRIIPMPTAIPSSSPSPQPGTSSIKSTTLPTSTSTAYNPPPRYSTPSDDDPPGQTSLKVIIESEPKSEPFLSEGGPTNIVSPSSPEGGSGENELDLLTLPGTILTSNEEAAQIVPDPSPTRPILSPYQEKLLKRMEEEYEQLDKDILSVRTKAAIAQSRWMEQEDRLLEVQQFLVERVRLLDPNLARDLRSRRQVTPLGDDKWRQVTNGVDNSGGGIGHYDPDEYEHEHAGGPTTQLDLQMTQLHSTIGVDREHEPTFNQSKTLNTQHSSNNEPHKISADIATAGDAIQNIPEQERDTRNYQTHDKDFFSKRELLSGQAEWYHVAAWTVGCILSAVFFSWNTGLIAGWGTMFIASIITGVGYTILTTCLAEMASALPFSGGSYGFARATMGKLPGMFVGLAESLEYVLTTAVNMLIFGTLCSQLFGTSIYLEPLWIFFAYVISVGLHIYGGRTYWNITLVLVVIDVLIVVLFVFGCAKFSVWSSITTPGNSVDGNSISGYFVNGMTGFMTVLPISIWWYTGIEAAPLTCEETVDAKRSVPKGMVWGMGIIIALNLGVWFVASSIPTDIDLGQPTLLESTFVTTAGFQKLFGLSSYTDPLLALILFPGIFVSAYGFIFAYGRQMYAMSRSGLLPSQLSLTSSTSTPHVAMISGSCLGFIVCVIARYAYTDPTGFAQIQTTVYNCMLLVALINYIFQLVSFLILKWQYSMLTRGYLSPYGAPGAVLGIIIFGTTFIALLGWGQKIWVAILAVTIYMSIGLGYYVLYSRKNLLLSPEEQVAMFMVYSIHFIRSKQNRVKNAKKYKLDDAIVQNMERQTAQRFKQKQEQRLLGGHTGSNGIHKSKRNERQISQQQHPSIVSGPTNGPDTSTDTVEHLIAPVQPTAIPNSTHIEHDSIMSPSSNLDQVHAIDSIWNLTSRDTVAAKSSRDK